MSLLTGALTMGCILALMALGVFLTFRIFGFADLATDSVLTLGAATAAVLLTRGVPPVPATLAATGAGMLAGCVTGALHTRLKINNLLSGILVMTGLYSVNLRIMGGSNVPLSQTATMIDMATAVARRLTGVETVRISVWEIPSGDLAVLVGAFLPACLIGLALRAFFRTDFGVALRASGDNAQSALAQGVSAPDMLLISLMLSGGLSALAGALMAQYQGFADVNMGRGAIVIGLAAVIIGEVIFGRLCAGKNLAFAYTLFSVIGGAIIYDIVMNVVLWLKLPSDDLKLFSAIVVAVFLAIPYLKSTRKGKER